MSQSDFGTIVATTKSGTQLAADLNAFRDALHSNHRGAARPSYAVAGMTWLDDSGGTIKWNYFDGTNDILIGTFNETTNVLTIEIDPTGSAVGDLMTSTGPSSQPTFQTPSVLPVGAVSMWAGSDSAAPTGWLICDGTAVLRTGATAALFTAIGTIYGAGDTTTTFNLPDFRGRAPIGVNNVSLPAGADGTLSTRNRADKAGAEDAVVIAHTHAATGLTVVNAGAHTHTAAALSGGGTTAATGSTVTPPIAGNTGSAGDHGHTITGATASAGVSGVGKNMSPFEGVNFIIKT